MMFEAQKSSVLTVDRGPSFVVEGGHQSERRAAVPQLQAQKLTYPKLLVPSSMWAPCQFVDPDDPAAHGCWWALLSENIYGVSGEGDPW
jgi:hypothetical protein